MYSVPNNWYSTSVSVVYDYLGRPLSRSLHVDFVRWVPVTETVRTLPFSNVEWINYKIRFRRVVLPLRIILVLSYYLSLVIGVIVFRSTKKLMFLSMVK